jgi:acyl carrier protein
VTRDARPQPRSDTAHVGTPAPAELTHRVCAVLMAKLADFLRAEDVTIDPVRPLVEYGIDSTDLLTLVFEIEEQFGCRFQAETFFDIETLNDLAERIAAALIAQDMTGLAPPPAASP